MVNGPSRTTATSKGFTVLVKNVGTGAFTTSNGDLNVTVNGNSGVVTCKPFSATIKPGRQTRAQCSANLDVLPLSVGNNVAYSATLDLPGDGFTANDTDTENRTAS